MSFGNRWRSNTGSRSLNLKILHLLKKSHIGYICAKFHQNLTTLLVEAYYGALHGSLQDWVFTVKAEGGLEIRKQNSAVLNVLLKKKEKKKRYDLFCS